MYAHDLANILLACPNKEVFICVSGQGGLLSPVKDAGVAKAQNWDEDDDYYVEVGEFEPGERIVIVYPEKFGD